MKVKIKIKNCSIEKMIIIKEPEAISKPFNINDEIEVETNSEEDNISLDIGKNEDGTIYVQIWDALNTRYVIYHEGKNIFEEFLE
jgi:hypothetical protein